jgi:hypothetical protein
MRKTILAGFLSRLRRRTCPTGQSTLRALRKSCVLSKKRGSKGIHVLGTNGENKSLSAGIKSEF